MFSQSWLSSGMSKRGMVMKWYDVYDVGRVRGCSDVRQQFDDAGIHTDLRHSAHWGDELRAG